MVQYFGNKNWDAQALCTNINWRVALWSKSWKENIPYTLEKLVRNISSIPNLFSYWLVGAAGSLLLWYCMGSDDFSIVIVCSPSNLSVVVEPFCPLGTTNPGGGESQIITRTNYFCMTVNHQTNHSMLPFNLVTTTVHQSFNYTLLIVFFVYHIRKIGCMISPLASNQFYVRTLSCPLLGHFWEFQMLSM